jgi:hypothetical protein
VGMCVAVLEVRNLVMVRLEGAWFGKLVCLKAEPHGSRGEKRHSDRQSLVHICLVEMKQARLLHKPQFTEGAMLLLQ